MTPPGRHVLAKVFQLLAGVTLVTEGVGVAPIGLDPAGVLTNFDSGPTIVANLEHIDVFGLVDAANESAAGRIEQVDSAADIARPDGIFLGRWRQGGGCTLRTQVAHLVFGTWRLSGRCGGWATALSTDPLWGICRDGGVAVSTWGGVDDPLSWSECCRGGICRNPRRPRSRSVEGFDHDVIILDLAEFPEPGANPIFQDGFLGDEETDPGFGRDQGGDRLNGFFLAGGEVDHLVIDKTFAGVGPVPVEVRVDQPVEIDIACRAGLGARCPDG